jgi:hypothetical protein
LRPPHFYLFVRLAFAVSRLGVVASSLRVALGLRRFFLTLRVLAFAVVGCSRPMALRSILVMFRRLGMGFRGHSILLGRVAMAIQLPTLAIVPRLVRVPASVGSLVSIARRRLEHD